MTLKNFNYWVPTLLNDDRLKSREVVEEENDILEIDYFFQEKNNPDEIVKVGKIEDKVINHIAYKFGIILSFYNLYEIRFEEYRKKINKEGGKGRTSFRVIIPSYAKEWVNWCEKNYLKLTVTKGSGRRTLDFFALSKKMEYINKEWWTEQQRSKIVYFKFKNDEEKQNYSINALLRLAEKTFGEFDRDEFKYYMELGMNLIPIDSYLIKHFSRKDLSFNKLQKMLFSIFNRKFNKYSISCLKDIIMAEAGKNYYSNKISCPKEHIIIDSIRWGALENNKTFYLKSLPFLSKKNNNDSFSKVQKKIIIKRYSYIVFNSTGDHCFNSVPGLSLQIVCWYALFRSLFGVKHKSNKIYINWANSFGGVKDVELVVRSTNERIYKEERMGGSNKIFTIEFHHFPCKETITKVADNRFPLDDERLAIPLFVEDHESLHGKSEKDSILFMLENKWKTEEEISEFVKNIIKTVSDIEKEKRLTHSLSLYLKEELDEFILD